MRLLLDFFLLMELKQGFRQIDLDISAGDALVFTGSGDEPGQAIRTNQENLPEDLLKIDPETVQLIAAVDKRAGGYY